MPKKLPHLTETLAERGFRGIQANYPLSRICTFRIGGEAKIILTPESAEELIFCIQALRELRIPYLTVGSASNLLFDDRGFEGAVIRTNKIKTATVENGILTAEAGVPLPSLCRIASENSIGGLHGLCGIPGTVGGSIITAAGAFGCNIYDHITEVSLFPRRKASKNTPDHRLGLLLPPKPPNTERRGNSPCFLPSPKRRPTADRGKDDTLHRAKKSNTAPRYSNRRKLFQTPQ